MSSKRAFIVVVATFLVVWPWAGAFGDTVATGTFTLDADISAGLPAPFTGSVSFDNTDRSVFGHTVNFGTAVGFATFTGSIDSVNATSPTSGGFSVSDFHDNIDGTRLSLQANGSFVCSPTGCTDGSTGSFVDTFTSVSGSAIAGLPSDLTYTGDGASGCTIIGFTQHCTGVFATNAFEPANTPESPGPETVPVSGTFFDPLTGSLRDFQVDVTFAQVTGAGSTTVAGVSNAPGTLPNNFQLETGGFNALFFDLSTTAQLAGDISVCIHYADVDGDGIVDGTSVHENALRLLHGEANVLVDRTSSIDFAQNEVCASVTSLSPFLLAVSIVGFIPPDQLSLLCENLAAKSVGKLGASVIQCAAKTPADRAATSLCESDVAGKYDAAIAKLSDHGCSQSAACLMNNVSSVREAVRAAADGVGVQAFCAGTAPAALKCGKFAANNMRKLATAIVKCNTKAASYAVAGKLTGVASTCQFAVQEKYDTANTKLTTLGCPNVASCLLANLDAIHDQLQTVLEGTSVQVYCAGGTSTGGFGF